MSSSPSAARPLILSSAKDRLSAGLLALFLGLFLVWGAGFAGASVIHDTAHDVRHGFGFPCH